MAKGESWSILPTHSRIVFTRSTFLDNLRSCSCSSSSVLDSINLQPVPNGGRKFAWPFWFSLVQMDLFKDTATAMRLRP
ncbi:hypothetical protein MUK42_35049 [Musa troglodytarum]|uniref:Uncharacterized protein n=1 Tax=Musa troglodytarum TaxID=320322 RepID=A0A9E7JXA2_9LILI|nr:hypothetical protein MUK42_35049 [Musa troglodytarum]